MRSQTWYAGLSDCPAFCFETSIRGPGGEARGGAYAEIVAIRNGRRL